MNEHVVKQYKSTPLTTDSFNYGQVALHKRMPLYCMRILGQLHANAMMVPVMLGVTLWE